MPKDFKGPAVRGTKIVLPKLRTAAKPRFSPGQSRMPQGLNPARGRVGGKPMLFPGRIGGR